MRFRYVAKRVAIAFVILTTSAFASPKQSSLIVGILEDTPGLYVGQPHYRSVRVVFYKEHGAWQAFPSRCPNPQCLQNVLAAYPKRLAWTVAFDGKRIGTVRTKIAEKFDFYSTVGQVPVVSGEVPTVGRPSREFAGFLGKAVFRPLVTNSSAFFRDPDGWNRGQLSLTLIARVREQFRRRFPKVSNCVNPEESVAKSWRYEDTDIKIESAYSSNKRWALARVQLEPYRCDGPSDDAFVDQWFLVMPDSSVRFLGKAMWLVDAGDYDNDGRSELVFSIDDYNRGGYVLFYDDFKKSVTFEFGYH
jgi:hypothetical protein